MTVVTASYRHVGGGASGRVAEALGVLHARLTREARRSRGAPVCPGRGPRADGPGRMWYNFGP